MEEYYDIAGKSIKLSEITNFEIKKCEYIFRPAFTESKKFFGKKYDFTGMEPYAVIIDEATHNSTGSIISDTITSIGNKINKKNSKSRKFRCKNQADRIFDTYLEEVPIVIKKLNGQQCEISKNDELYKTIAKTTTPSIEIIDALVINAQQEYWFYGNGIIIDDDDVKYQYQNLKALMNDYENEKKVIKRLENPKQPVTSGKKVTIPFWKK